MFAPEKEYERMPLPEEGPHVAVCCGVSYQEGVEFGKNKYKSESDPDIEITITFQLAERIPDDFENAKFAGKRYELRRSMRLSTGEKSNLHKMFQPWFGKKIADYIEQYKEKDDLVAWNENKKKWDIEWNKLIGRSCYINTEHKVGIQSGKTYTNIIGYMPLAGGMSQIEIEKYDENTPTETVSDRPELDEPSDDQSQATVDDVPSPTDNDLPF